MRFHPVLRRVTAPTLAWYGLADSRALQWPLGGLVQGRPASPERFRRFRMAGLWRHRRDQRAAEIILGPPPRITPERTVWIVPSGATYGGLLHACVDADFWLACVPCLRYNDLSVCCDLPTVATEGGRPVWRPALRLHCVWPPVYSLAIWPSFPTVSHGLGGSSSRFTPFDESPPAGSRGDEPLGALSFTERSITGIATNSRKKYGMSSTSLPARSLQAAFIVLLSV